jgi:hypothetical protein
MKNITNLFLSGLILLNLNCVPHSKKSKFNRKEFLTLESFQGKLFDKFAKYESKDDSVHFLKIYDMGGFVKEYFDNNGDFKVDSTYSSDGTKFNFVIDQREFKNGLIEIQNIRPKKTYKFTR